MPHLMLTAYLLVTLTFCHTNSDWQN